MILHSNSRTTQGMCSCHNKALERLTFGGFGTNWMTDLSNNNVKEDCIPDDWRNNSLVHVYTGKGDPLVYGFIQSY